MIGTFICAGAVVANIVGCGVDGCGCIHDDCWLFVIQWFVNDIVDDGNDDDDDEDDDENNDGEEIIDPEFGLDTFGLVANDDDGFHPGWFGWIWNIL